MPSKPYLVMMAYRLLVKFVASAVLPTETEPFCPPSERMTFLPFARLAATSAMNCASVPAPGSMVRLTLPPPALSPKETTITSQSSLTWLIG
ncbi:hypothetical protein D3C81_1472320 [compost metagenome]